MPKLAEKLEDILNLVERLPLHYYAAVTKELSDDFKKQAVKAERLGIAIEMAGDEFNYGILLKRSVRDRLIRCLKSVTSGRRGRPSKDDADRMEQARADLKQFDAAFAQTKKKGLAYERLEKTWNLTNRQVRNRISAARKLIGDDTVPF